MRRIPDDWSKLMAISRQLAAADDATSSVVIEKLPADTPYNIVLSRHQAWQNKYNRATQRGLIEHPYRIRRVKVKGRYVIEAALDLTAALEGAMAEWLMPDE